MKAGRYASPSRSRKEAIRSRDNKKMNHLRQLWRKPHPQNTPQRRVPQLTKHRSSTIGTAASTTYLHKLSAQSDGPESYSAKQGSAFYSFISVNSTTDATSLTTDADVSRSKSLITGRDSKYYSKGHPPSYTAAGAF